MSKLNFNIEISYSQLCVFLHHLENPFNYWSERSYSQGFAWREGSASFRTLTDGVHNVNVSFNENVPSLPDDCVWAFRVPFDITSKDIEIGSISDSKIIELEPTQYILQVEFFAIQQSAKPSVNLRFNIGNTDFLILKANEEIEIFGDFDVCANAAQ